MRDRVFLETNILIYPYSQGEDDKRGSAYKFVNDADCITGFVLTSALEAGCNIILTEDMNDGQVIGAF